MNKDNNDKYFRASLYVGSLLICAVIGVALAFKAEGVINAVGYVVNAVHPVGIGALIAYLLLPAASTFESKIYAKILKGASARTLRLVSVISVFVILVVFVSLVSFLLIPQLLSNYSELAANAQRYVHFAEEFANDVISRLGVFGDKNTLSELLGGVELEEFIGSLIVDSFLLADKFVSGVASVAGGIISLIKNTVYSLICAFGIMLYSGKISSFFYETSKVLFGEKKTDSLRAVLRIADRAFGGFFSGKLFESLLIGLISLVIFYVFGMPYPPLLAVILGFFNLIPYFGSVFSALIGGVIVFVADPPMLVWFIVIDLLTEQFDANILAPRVLGNTVGLHPLLIIVSITVMGSLFGIIGLVIGVPVAALVVEAVRHFCAVRENNTAPLSDTDEALVGEEE